MSARADYPFPAAVADGRVNGGAYGRLECANALDEIDELRADVDRLRAQLERTRTELAAATVRLAEWDRMNTVLAAVLPALREQMEPTPSREAGL